VSDARNREKQKKKKKRKKDQGARKGQEIEAENM